MNLCMNRSSYPRHLSPGREQKNIILCLLQGLPQDDIDGHLHGYRGRSILLLLLHGTLEDQPTFNKEYLTCSAGSRTCVCWFRPFPVGCTNQCATKRVIGLARLYLHLLHPTKRNYNLV